MIVWLKKIINTFFLKDKAKTIEAPKIVNNIQNNKNDFIVSLKRQADVEQDDGNGYRIISNLRLEDMV